MAQTFQFRLHALPVIALELQDRARALPGRPLIVVTVLPPRPFVSRRMRTKPSAGGSAGRFDAGGVALGTGGLAGTRRPSVE